MKFIDVTLEKYFEERSNVLNKIKDLSSEQIGVLLDAQELPALTYYEVRDKENKEGFVFDFEEYEDDQNNNPPYIKIENNNDYIFGILFRNESHNPDKLYALMDGESADAEYLYHKISDEDKNNCDSIFMITEKKIENESLFISNLKLAETNDDVSSAALFNANFYGKISFYDLETEKLFTEINFK